MTTVNGPPYPNTHKALTHFIQYASSNREIRSGLHLEKPRVCAAFLKSLLEFTQRLEGLSPDGDDHPNPEYPWKDNVGIIQSPLYYPFLELQERDNPQMRKLLHFVRVCFEIVKSEIKS